MSALDPTRAIAVVCIQLLLLTASSARAAETPAELALEGDVLLNQSEHGDAIAKYEQALEGGLDTAALHFNLGLAYAHTEELGKATFHLTQAHFLAPRTSDYQDSLALVRAEAERRRAEDATGEVTMGQPSAVTWLDFFARLRRGEVELVILITVWLAFAVLTVRRRMLPSGRRDAAAVFAVFLFVLLALASTYRVGAEITGHTIPGVVVTENPTVREGPDRYASTVADSGLSIGSIVVILEERDDWASVELPDERTGWLDRSAIRTVHVRDR